DEDRLPGPLRSRFVIERLELYRRAELEEILAAATREKGLGQGLTPEAQARLARASRGTPRRALQLLGAVVNEAAVAGVERADLELVERALRREGVDRRGLTPLERAYLKALREAGGPLSLRTLSGRLEVSQRVLRETVEPFLLNQRLILITSRGRGLVPEGAQEERQRA